MSTYICLEEIYGYSQQGGIGTWKTINQSFLVRSELSSFGVKP